MRSLKFVICAAALLALTPAHAQDAVDVAKAKAEGKVVWYTSTPIEQAQKIVALFKQQPGIKVELFRSGGSAILSRFQQEMTPGASPPMWSPIPIRRPPARSPRRDSSFPSSRRISTRSPTPPRRPMACTSASASI